jgi:predicted histone-like DNA-binding protein
MYVAHLVSYSLISLEQLIQMAASDSGMSESNVAAALYALATQVEELVLTGHSVDLGVLGILRASFSCKAKERIEDLDYTCITRRRFIFTPSDRLKTALYNAHVEGFGGKSSD